MTYTMMIKVLNRVGTDITAKDAARFLKASIIADSITVATKDFILHHNLNTGKTHKMDIL